MYVILRMVFYVRNIAYGILQYVRNIAYGILCTYVILCMLHNNIYKYECSTYIRKQQSKHVFTYSTYVHMCVHVQACYFFHVQGEDGDVGATGSPGEEGQKVS